MKFSKKTLSFAVLGLFALALVTAGVLSYYGQAKSTVHVNQHISFSVDGVDYTGEQYAEDVNCDAGDVCLSDSAYRVSNDGDSDTEVSILASGSTNVVGVDYVGQLELTTKNTETWEATDDKKATLVYTLVGENFNTDVELGEGYILVYALDNDHRFIDYASVIKVEDIDSNLPLISDWNANPSPDYCDDHNGFDDYEHCNGAKLWIVKESDLGTPDEDGVYPLSWSNMNSYLYETDLIRYFHNSDGKITVPANSYIEFFPQFSVNSMAEDGDYVIYTTIDEVTA